MKRTCFVLLLIAWLGCRCVWAGEETFDTAINHRFSVYGGVQRYQADGEFSLTQNGNPKTTLDMGDVGLDENKTTPVFGAVANYGKYLTLRFDYYGYHDDAKKTAEFDFDFGDEIVTAGAKLDTKLDLDVYVISLAYNFYSSPRAKFGMGLGVHIADIDLKIASDTTLNGGSILKQEDRINYTAPLPNIYAGGAYAFTDKLLLRYSGGWMDLGYREYNGQLVSGTAALEYWPFRHAGLGLGYRYVKVKVDYDTGHQKEDYDIKLPGPILYATYGF